MFEDKKRPMLCVQSYPMFECFWLMSISNAHECAAYICRQREDWHETNRGDGSIDSCGWDGNMPGSSSIPAWGAGDMHTLMRNIGKCRKGLLHKIQVWKICKSYQLTPKNRCTKLMSLSVVLWLLLMGISYDKFKLRVRSGKARLDIHSTAW